MYQQYYDSKNEKIYNIDIYEHIGYLIFSPLVWFYRNRAYPSCSIVTKDISESEKNNRRLLLPLGIIIGIGLSKGISLKSYDDTLLEVNILCSAFLLIFIEMVSIGILFLIHKKLRNQQIFEGKINRSKYIFVNLKPKSLGNTLCVCLIAILQLANYLFIIFIMKEISIGNILYSFLSTFLMSALSLCSMRTAKVLYEGNVLEFQDFG